VQIIVSPNGNVRGLMLSRIERNGVSYRDGFDVAAGQQITGVRLVFTYGRLTLHGQLKIIGGSLPSGIHWFILASRPDQPRQNLQLGAEVDARGEFTLEHLSPGEYELKVVPTGGVNPQTLSAIFAFKESVVVTANNPPIAITLDLRDKEHEK
jgi:hypothetical protein